MIILLVFRQGGSLIAAFADGRHNRKREDYYSLYG